jgi:hypothetical protein
VPERRKFPSLDDPTRFDAIVGRGRSLRRRRQFGMGAGAGGGVAAVALAVVMVTGTGGNGGPTEQEIVADDDKVEVVETTVAPTTTTTLPAPPTEFVAEVEADGDEITVTLTDPAQPVSEDSRQCVLVTVEGAGGLTEVLGCDDVPAVDGVVTLDVPPDDGVQIGCAATIFNPALPVGDETQLKSTTFSMKVPADFAAGDYSVQVEATSGLGDGCAGTGDEAEPGAPASPGASEYATSASTTITVD